MLETVWQDVRHGVRMLTKNPGFSLIAIVSIAIGVGANTAMFSVADGLILRPLALPDADALAIVSTRTPTGEIPNAGTSYPDYADVRDRAKRFEGLVASRWLMASVTSRPDESARGASGLAVSGNFFDVLGVQPALGRAFLPDEDRVGGRDAVVVLSHEAWTERFGSDSSLIGRQIRLAGQPLTVVGIAPQGFNGAEFFVAPAFYVPLAKLPVLEPGAPPDPLQHRDVRTLRVLGRLAPGATRRTPSAVEHAKSACGWPWARCRPRCYGWSCVSQRCRLPWESLWACWQAPRSVACSKACFQTRVATP